MFLSSIELQAKVSAPLNLGFCARAPAPLQRCSLTPGAVGPFFKQSAPRFRHKGAPAHFWLTHEKMAIQYYIHSNMYIIQVTHEIPVVC